jgi:hypothetical protein
VNVFSSVSLMSALTDICHAPVKGSWNAYEA